MNLSTYLGAVKKIGFLKVTSINTLNLSIHYRRSIEAIHGYEDKVRIVLNKADQVDHQELMRVYGALMWSISKVSKKM
jgi:hypothetical protein